MNSSLRKGRKKYYAIKKVHHLLTCKILITRKFLCLLEKIKRVKIHPLCTKPVTPRFVSQKEMNINNNASSG